MNKISNAELAVLLEESRRFRSLKAQQSFQRYADLVDQRVGLTAHGVLLPELDLDIERARVEMDQDARRVAEAIVRERRLAQGKERPRRSRVH